MSRINQQYGRTENMMRLDELQEGKSVATTAGELQIEMLTEAGERLAERSAPISQNRLRSERE